jgi:hypothetical protein
VHWYIDKIKVLIGVLSRICTCKGLALASREMAKIITHSTIAVQKDTST